MNPYWTSEKKMATRNTIMELSRKAMDKKADPDRIQLALDLSSLAYDADLPQVLRGQLYTVWASSRCANRELVNMTLQLIANTITD